MMNGYWSEEVTQSSSIYNGPLVVKILFLPLGEFEALKLQYN